MTWQTFAPELIYEILDQCRANSKTLSVTKPHFFPWYLGHICKAWREVFVSSPQFWSTLDMDLDFTTFGLDEVRKFTVLEVTRIGIVRSKDCPISFRLSSVDYFLPSDIALCRQIIEILVANSARWLDASIYILADEMATIYAAKNRMSLLRSMCLTLRFRRLDNHTFRISDAAKLYSDFLVGATQLTRISFDFGSPFWKINWSLITVVHFNDTAPPLSQLLAYLSQMSCLMELVFFGDCEGDKTSKEGMVPITLPHLKSLYSPAALLPVVETPALQELHIRNDVSMIEHVSALTAIISRFFQPIRHLTKLDITTNFWEHAAVIVEHMPKVDHLTLCSESAVELIKILEGYQQIGFLTTVTFILLTNEVWSDHLLETVTSWKRETGGNKGIGPFHKLMEMSFKLVSGNHQPFVDRLKMHLEEQGMHYSVTEDPLGISYPRFVLW